MKKLIESAKSFFLSTIVDFANKLISVQFFIYGLIKVVRNPFLGIMKVFGF